MADAEKPSVRVRFTGFEKKFSSVYTRSQPLVVQREADDRDIHQVDADQPSKYDAASLPRPTEERVSPPKIERDNNSKITDAGSLPLDQFETRHRPMDTLSNKALAMGIGVSDTSRNSSSSLTTLSPDFNGNVKMAPNGSTRGLLLRPVLVEVPQAGMDAQPETKRVTIVETVVSTIEGDQPPLAEGPAPRRLVGILRNTTKYQERSPHSFEGISAQIVANTAFNARPASGDIPSTTLASHAGGPEYSHTETLRADTKGSRASEIQYDPHAPSLRPHSTTSPTGVAAASTYTKTPVALSGATAIEADSSSDRFSETLGRNDGAPHSRQQDTLASATNHTFSKQSSSQSSGTTTSAALTNITMPSLTNIINRYSHEKTHTGGAKTPMAIAMATATGAAVPLAGHTPAQLDTAAHEQAPQPVAQTTAPGATPGATPGADHAKRKSKLFLVNNVRYMSLKELGAGGSARVHKVMAADTFDICALKVVYITAKRPAGGRGHGHGEDTSDCENNGGDDDLTSKAAIQREIDIMKALRGTGVSLDLIDYQFVDYAPGQSVAYIVMELGELDLKQYIRDHVGILSEHRVGALLEDIATSLNKMHELSFIHCDLKPQNFMFHKGRLKIIDFGISKKMEADTTMIVRSSLLGTPKYIAPEVVASRLDGRARIHRVSDVWSVGSMVFELVAGFNPFDDLKRECADNYLQMMLRIKDGKYEIHWDRLRCSDPLKDLIRQMLEHDDRRRIGVPGILTHEFMRRGGVVWS